MIANFYVLILFINGNNIILTSEVRNGILVYSKSIVEFTFDRSSKYVKFLSKEITFYKYVISFSTIRRLEARVVECGKCYQGVKGVHQLSNECFIHMENGK